ncbi:MAG: 16S rRNA (uracil(1498)-N(3))-methyltransferase [Gammaproteobacteria bacterium]|nr:16S rRNA (uracil(1498)-N(3))-methyltransferase [Gammaproteobacteria bacterium]
MRDIRIYQNSDLLIGCSIKLNEDASHHLIHVLRIKTGQQVVLFNGLGGEFLGEVISIEKKNVAVIIKEFSNIDRESSLSIHLGQSISKGDRMDFVIQKATELGVKEITPMISERCDVKLDEARWQKRLAHWRHIMINACEQCGRNILPQINHVIPFSVWVTKVTEKDKLIFDQQARFSLQNSLNKLTEKEIVLAIGPEGGFSDKEIVLAEQHYFIPVSLGKRMLRTETAALAAIAACQTLWGDFSET